METLSSAEHWASGWEAVVIALVFLVGGVGTFAGILIHAQHARRRAQHEYEEFLAHPRAGARK